MIVGTAGHIDHGKTSLVRALTGVDTDRLKEEKARGISIDLGFAYLPAPDGAVIGFVDVPGHEKFVRNMLAGATGIDFAMLVVAADDGVMPQTREHLAIIDLLGIARGVVVLTKTDLVSLAQQAEVAAEIADMLAGTSLAQADIVPVSVKDDAAVAALRERLFSAARAHSERVAGGLFRLAVDRCFTLTGHGTIVTGTVLSGQITVGDHVTVSPAGLRARIRSIHAQNREAKTGGSGQRCALNLAGEGISTSAIARGDVVLDPVLHAPTDRIDARVRLLAGELKPLATWMPVWLHHAATDVAARIVLLEGAPIAPGGEGRVQLVLERPIAAAAGDRFVLRDTTAQRTIGGGQFLDLRAPARKRRTPDRLAQLDMFAIADCAKAVAGLLAAAPRYLDVAGFARDRAVAASDVVSAAAASGGFVELPGTSLIFAADVWRTLESSVVDALAAFHRERPDAAGLPVALLRGKVEPRLAPGVFASVVQTLARNATVALDGAAVRLPAHATTLAPTDEAAWKQILPRLSDAERFRPPRVRDLAEQLSLREGDVRRLLKGLAQRKVLAEIAADHFFLRTAVAEIAGICADLSAQSPDGHFVAAQLRDRLDNGRKVAIQILEFFDRHGVTVRRGDQRRINPQKRDFFNQAVSQVAASSSGGEASPVGRPDFKSGRGRQTVPGGFDSLSLPPRS
jgi:selenocysteine-specific elongation factor